MFSNDKTASCDILAPGLEKDRDAHEGGVVSSQHPYIKDVASMYLIN